MLKKAALALTLSFAALTAWAAAPDAVIGAMTGQMLEKLDKGTPSAEQVGRLVDEVVMPNVDFETMTARAVGRHWRAASAEQRQALQQGFRSLLLKTYAGALTQAKGAKVKLIPMRGEKDPGVATVRTTVSGAGLSEPVSLNYRMEARGEDWKVVDVSVMDVWIVNAYQSSFAQEIAKGGVDGLIQTLKDKAAKR